VHGGKGHIYLVQALRTEKSMCDNNFSNYKSNDFCYIKVNS
jgi:hypothetical protein